MSEERIEQDFDLRRQIRGVPRGKPLWSQSEAREGEAGSEANVGRGNAERSPSKKSMWEIAA